MKTLPTAPAKLTEFQTSRGNLIINRAQRANLKGEGYRIPESYNSSYFVAASYLIAKKILRVDSAKGKRGGFWTVKQPNPAPVVAAKAETVKADPKPFKKSKKGSK